MIDSPFLRRSFRLIAVALLTGAPALAGQRVRISVPYEQLQAAAVRDSNDAAAHYNLAIGHWSTGKYDDAGRSLRTALLIEPRFALAHLALSFLPFARRGRLWNESLEDRVPAMWVDSVAESDRAYRRALLADPLVDLRIMGAVEPGMPVAWQSSDFLSRLYDIIFRGFDDFRDGKYEQAYSRFNQMAQTLDWDGHPERASVSFLYYRGLSAAHIGRWPEAITDVREIYDRLKAREAERRDSITYLPLRTNEFRYLLADMYMRNNEPERAEPLFREVAEQDIGNYMAHVRLADLHEAGRRWESAIAERRLATESNPDDASMQTDLGVTLGKAGRFAGAEVALAQAATDNPRDTRSLYWLGIAQGQLGKSAEAKQSFERFVALAPSRFARQVESARARLAQLGGGE